MAITTTHHGPNRDDQCAPTLGAVASPTAVCVAATPAVLTIG